MWFPPSWPPLNHQIGPLKAIPHDVDRVLHALSVLLGRELDYRFKALADQHPGSAHTRHTQRGTHSGAPTSLTSAPHYP